MRKSNEIINAIQSIINELPALEEVHVAVQENQMVNKLKDKYGVQICMIMPETQFKGQLSNRNYYSSTWIFVLEKLIPDHTQAEELAQYDRLETITHQIIEKIFDTAEEGCNIFSKFEPTNLQITPEYNTFGEFNGWSFNIIL